MEPSQERGEQALLADLRLHEQAGDRREMARACGELGAVYQEQGRLEQSMAMWRRALVLSEAELDDGLNRLETGLSRTHRVQ